MVSDPGQGFGHSPRLRRWTRAVAQRPEWLLRRGPSARCRAQPQPRSSGKSAKTRPRRRRRRKWARLLLDLVRQGRIRPNAVPTGTVHFLPGVSQSAVMIGAEVSPSLTRATSTARTPISRKLSRSIRNMRALTSTAASATSHRTIAEGARGFDGSQCAEPNSTLCRVGARAGRCRFSGHGCTEPQRLAQRYTL